MWYSGSETRKHRSNKDVFMQIQLKVKVLNWKYNSSTSIKMGQIETVINLSLSLTTAE